MTPRPSIKREALRLVEQLPEHASWDDLMYEIYVRQAIERGSSPDSLGPSEGCLDRDRRRTPRQHLRIHREDLPTYAHLMVRRLWDRTGQIEAFPGASPAA
jgi:hypothetical protein